MTSTIRILLGLTLVLSALWVRAETAPALVPQPLSLSTQSGTLELRPGFSVAYNEGAASVAHYLAEAISPAMGQAPQLIAGNLPGASLVMTLLDEPLTLKGEPLGEEGYTLLVGRNTVYLKANSEAGLFYAVQTLRQLLPVEIFADRPQQVAWRIPRVDIADGPQFTWRGMHLDVGRHFMPVDFVKKYIDLLALHKMNTFHWHLTEDQGWRIEIKKYPKLTEIGSCRDETMVGHYYDRPWWAWFTFWRPAPHTYDGQRYCGFYTQDDIREVVAYAAQRHVNVVPEIEMPGHAQAATVAYPELASTDESVGVKREWGISHYIYNPEDSTIDFLKDVLLEVMELFPSEFIHIGGDEAHKDLWRDSERVQQLIAERGLADEDEMQSWFIRQFDTFLAEHGRRLIGWDEILEGGLAPGATVMSWRGAKGGIAAAQAGHDVVMADNRFTYFDYYQSKDKGSEPLAIGGFLPLETVYDYNPIPAELDADQGHHILGAQGQVWTEYIKTPEHVEYMAFPRASALSEVVWRNAPEADRDYSLFLERMTVHLKRLDQLDVNYRPLD